MRVNLNGYLVKAPPELVRPATYEEEMADEQVPGMLRKMKEHLEKEDGQVEFEDVGRGFQENREGDGAEGIPEGVPEEDRLRGAGTELRKN